MFNVSNINNLPCYNWISWNVNGSAFREIPAWLHIQSQLTSKSIFNDMNLTLSSLSQPQDDVRVVHKMSKPNAKQKEAGFKSKLKSFSELKM